MARGGRQTVEYRARFGQTDNPNASSAERAAQSAFAKQRSGGFQVASPDVTVTATIGDIIAVENSSTSTRPIVVLPTITAEMTGKTVTVTFAKKSTTAYFKVSAADGINLAPTSAVSKANRTITSPVRGYVYLAIAPGYGWRETELSS